MSDLFISYSRKDAAFVRMLHAELSKRGLDTWVDWEDIPPTAQWLAELNAAIQAADTFVFVISPDSVASSMCKRELAHAVEQHKRLVPIVRRDVDAGAVPDVLGSIQWLFFRSGDDYAVGFSALVQAVHADLEWVRTHTRLLTRAAEWDGHKRNASFLLRGDDLRSAEAWLGQAGAGRGPAPTELQAEYILASRAAASRQQRVALGGALLGLVVALGLALVALVQRDVAQTQTERAVSEASLRATAQAAAEEQRAVAQLQRAVAEEQRAVAERQRAVAVSRQLAAQAASRLDDQLDLALLLGVQAYRAAPTREARRALLASLGRTPQLVAFLWGDPGSVSELAFSPDGGMLLAGGTTRTTRWDVAARTVMAPPSEHPPNAIKAVAVSRAGTALALNADNGRIELRDVARDRAVGPPTPASGGAGPRLGTVVATAAVLAFPSDRQVVVWDLATGLASGPPLVGHASPVVAVAVSRDGGTLASADRDGTVIIWDVPSCQKLGSSLVDSDRVGVTTLALSADGRTLAWGTGASGAQGEGESTIRLWDVGPMRNGGTARRRDPLLTGHQATMRLAFSPDGGTLASAACRAFARYGAGCTHGEIRLWDVARARPLADPLWVHAGSIASLAFAPSGTILAAAGTNGSIGLWDLGAAHPLARQVAEHALAIGPGGSPVAQRDGDTVRLSDVVGGQSLGVLGDGPDRAAWRYAGGVMAVSPNGQRVAWAGCPASDDPSCDRGDIRVWDVRDLGAGGARMQGRAGSTVTLTFSDDGRRLASYAPGIGVVIWDSTSGQPLGPPVAVHDATVLAFNRSGATLAIGTPGAVLIWDIDRRQQAEELAVPPGQSPEPADGVASVAFSPDGTTLVVGTVPINGTTGEVLRWDLASGRLLEKTAVGQAGAVEAVRFSPDGTLLVGGAGDAITLLDTDGFEPLGLLDSGHPPDALRDVIEVTFGADGKMLATRHRDGTVYLWEVGADAWLDRACRRANRLLRDDEWRQYVGEGSPPRACPPS